MHATTSQANASNLTHVTTASRVAKCITSRPATPVVVHWQLPDFPVRVAQVLARKQRLVWVVATTERGDIAERELSAAGILVHRIHTESDEAAAELDSRANLQQVRAKAKRDLALSRAQYPQPDAHTVTVISIHRICHRRPLEEIAGWDSALIVFDHIGGLNARWMDVDSGDEDGQASPRLIGVRAEGGHPIPVFHAKGIPMVFVTRDELEGALIRADFNQRGCEVASLATKYTAPRRLKVTIVATDLVTSKYAAGAFLSVLVCHPDVQVVGEALIGAITPQKLSMATPTPLKRAALKISHQHPDHAEAWRVQTRLPADVMQIMRIRDFIRTSVLAFDTAPRKPELVIFCPWNLAEAVATYSGGTTVHLAAWTPRRPGYEVKNHNSLVDLVIDSAASYLGELNHGGRLRRLVEAVLSEKPKDVPKKIARLALALHSASALGQALDLTGRPERVSGLSPLGDKAVGLFNRILDAVYPWSSHHPSENRDSLDARQEVLLEYGRLIEARAGVRCKQTQAKKTEQRRD